MTNELAMNVEEDAELRELLISNLESRGVLSRIKADLRAAIFQCLDEKGQNLAEVNQDAKLPLSLCADLLETLGLYSTNKVVFINFYFVKFYIIFMQKNLGAPN